jgi:multiple PDZ domain protein
MIYFEITKNKGAKGLGFSLIDYHQNPIMKPFSKSIIVIRALVPNGVAQLDGRLVPGQRLISINELNLNGDDTKNDLLKVAVEYLKSLSVGQSG